MASENDEKKTDTWMPLYVSDYLADTMHLTTEQHGAYLLLLMACWKGDGRIQNNDGLLAAITRLPANRWRACRLTLLKFFEIADDYITHKRVLKERAKAKKNSAERAEAGKKGAAKRWQTDGNCHSKAMANGMANGQQKDTPPPSPVRATEPIGSGADAPADPIWGTGLAFLKRKGLPDRPARSLLGQLRKTAGDVEVGALLAQAEAQDISDPSAWLMAAAVAARDRRDGRTQPSKTLNVIQQFEALKHGGLADNGTSDRIPETALLGFGSDPGD